MGKKRKYIKEKLIYCGEKYLEIDIFKTYEKPKRGRAKKFKETEPKMKRLNDKRAKRYFIQLVNTNFTDNDIHITCTYNDENIPSSVEEAERIAKNFLRRVNYKRNKKGIEKLKYILVTEYKPVSEKYKGVRVHHHIIMNKGLTREELEELWRLPKRKGEKEGKKIGFINADRLQTNEYGLENIARYLTKEPAGKKRWIPSRNLKKPVILERDSRLTNYKLQKLIKENDREYWEKRYKNYILTEFKPIFNEITSFWSLYIKMRRIDT